MEDGIVRVALPDGRTSSMWWDDVDAGAAEVPKIEIADNHSSAHVMPETWLRSRVRGWMELNESPGQDYWIGTYTSEGKWIDCSSGGNRYLPLMHRVDMARRICRHVNKTAGEGGVWFVGWIRGGHQLYLLWKDADGDIRCPIECAFPFTVLNGWPMSAWENHCLTAIKVMRGIEETTETTKGQKVKLAQGQRMDVGRHMGAAPRQDIILP